jgi:GDPmannose 4,6-dehydratase
MNGRTALIVGASGQDGILLARHLLGLGYRVVGTTRRLDEQPMARLAAVGILDHIQMVTLNPCDPAATARLVGELKPQEIYNLAGQSSVGSSFQAPFETVESVTRGTLALLEAIRSAAPKARLFNTGSSECFGNTPTPATESTPFSPRSPYGAAKAAGMHLVSVYRAAYGLYACSGITFNHESPLRPPHFVTRKVAAFVAGLRCGGAPRLKVGDLSIRRDWGWAPDYVEAFHLMLQADEPRDLILATGRSSSLAEFVAACFASVGLSEQDHIEVDPSLFRPSEIQNTLGDPSAASEILGWRAKKFMPEIAGLLVRHELDRAQGSR